MEIEEVTHVTDEVVAAWARLMPQLSPSSASPTKAALAQVAASPGTVWLVARDAEGGQIVGTLTLALYRVPTGVRAWIEDLVVDAAARRRGVGEALTRAALLRAAEAGATTVDLTSRPAREAANRLYHRLGFALRATNVYRYQLSSKDASS